jgi:hypothetical protein
MKRKSVLKKPVCPMVEPAGAHTVLSNIPIPDPSVLTAALVDRAISQLDARLETRFNSNEHATNATHEEVNRRLVTLQELIQTKLDLIDGTNDEVFKRIEVQFTERDKRTDQLALASATAIAAALQAAKEAVGAQNTSNSIAIAKSESSTLESLRQLRELFISENRATNAKVDDLKSRLDKGEGKGSVTEPANAELLRTMQSGYESLRSGADKGVGGAEKTMQNWAVAAVLAGVVVACIGIINVALHFVH